MSSVATQRARVFAPELDVLRGIAAVLMILNHAGFRLLSGTDAATSPSAVAVFLGGFAPVVFFFATGFGIALSTRASAGVVNMRSVLWKAALLVVADQWFYWRHGVAGGFDFFGFIALASVTVTVIASRSRPVLICLSLALALLVLRYAVGPLLRSSMSEFAIWNWVTGVQAVEHVSYPLSPWMVYPLLGFALGWFYEPIHTLAPGIRLRLYVRGAVCAIGFGGLSLVLALVFKSSFFRWGMVSAGFLVLSLGVLMAATLVAWWLSVSHPKLASGVALRGVASFAVIPIHYAMLDLREMLLPLPVAQWAYALLAAGIIVSAFFLSSRFSTLVSGISNSTYRRSVVPMLLAALVVLSLGVISGVTRNAAAIALMALLAQLLVAALLGIKPQAAQRSAALPA
jgi:hypothetical protein